MREVLRGLVAVVGSAVLTLFICLGLIVVGLWLLFSLDIPSSIPPPQEAASPTWSPDGQRVAFECYLEGPTQPVRDSDQREYRSDAADICVINADGSHQVRLTSNDVADQSPVWSPDGSYIAYTSGTSIYVMNSDGSNQRQLVDAHNDIPDWVAWSPDGKYLTFSTCLETSDRNIYIIDINTGRLTNLTGTNEAQDTYSRWMPDGRHIVFLSADLSADASCELSSHPSTASRLKMINLDGTDEMDVYREAFYTFVSVSATGQIAFVANMKARDDIQAMQLADDTFLYAIRPGAEEAVTLDNGMWSAFWSPDGQYLTDGHVMLNVETMEKRRLRSDFSPSFFVAWSPDGRKLATTSTEEIGNIYANRIVILDLDLHTVSTLAPQKEPLGH
jgi:Tol biopolymer transport system component